MSSPLHNELESALAGLRAQHQRIRAAQDRIDAQTTTHTSKDRMVAATVDSRQRLTGLTLSGTRYRRLAPAELASRIVQAVAAAQEEAAGKSRNVLAELAPAGFGPGLADLVNGDLDIERIFDEAVQAASGPLFRDEPAGLFGAAGPAGGGTEERS